MAGKLPDPATLALIGLILLAVEPLPAAEGHQPVLAFCAGVVSALGMVAPARRRRT